MHASHIPVKALFPSLAVAALMSVPAAHQRSRLFAVHQSHIGVEICRRCICLLTGRPRRPWR